MGRKDNQRSRFLRSGPVPWLGWARKPFLHLVGQSIDVVDDTENAFSHKLHVSEWFFRSVHATVSLFTQPFRVCIASFQGSHAPRAHIVQCRGHITLRSIPWLVVCPSWPPIAANELGLQQSGSNRIQELENASIGEHRYQCTAPTLDTLLNKVTNVLKPVIGPHGAPLRMSMNPIASIRPMLMERFGGSTARRNQERLDRAQQGS
mmetsp:Transcript_8127/g.29989  ORF Transcript_8127/g.29989 Transcript_8127/m.29989 type:complete len:206 (+) Transcript_8127:914-1531(+)|eukprot:scaffold326_cov376-Prasinococcus_capsulatus_cf.AAC.2